MGGARQAQLLALEARAKRLLLERDAALHMLAATCTADRARAIITPVLHAWRRSCRAIDGGAPKRTSPGRRTPYSRPTQRDAVRGSENEHMAQQKGRQLNGRFI